MVWRGSNEEWEELLECIERNCIGGTDREVYECGASEYDTGCPAHRLLDSQDVMDSLLLMMRSHAASLTPETSLTIVGYLASQR